jgi:hypothetical protein
MPPSGVFNARPATAFVPAFFVAGPLRGNRPPGGRHVHGAARWQVAFHSVQGRKHRPWQATRQVPGATTSDPGRHHVTGAGGFLVVH